MRIVKLKTYMKILKIIKKKKIIYNIINFFLPFGRFYIIYYKKTF